MVLYHAGVRVVVVCLVVDRWVVNVYKTVFPAGTYTICYMIN